jgi:hypothetical protein
MSDSDSDSDSNSGSEEQPLPAIHAAVRNLDVGAVRRELAAGANVDAWDSGKTPLYVVCQCGTPPVDTMALSTWKGKVREREAIVAALLRAGANVNARCRGLYGPSRHLAPLKAACFDKDFPPSDIVAQLLAAGADIEAADNNGFFPLYSAAQSGRADTVSRLLAAGADPHRRRGGSGATVLEGATLTGNVRTYAPLLRAGVALPPYERRKAYLTKIAETPGGYPAYERAHRARLAAIFVPKFPRLPVEVIHHVVSIWADCGGH